MNNSTSSMCLKKTLLVFCEGQTEFNYYNHYKNNKKFSFKFKPVDVTGGGYRNMLDSIKKSGNQGIMAKVVLLDLDRFLSIHSEQFVFKELCDYINSQNVKGSPVILIMSNPDFDEFILLHNVNYSGNRKLFLPTIGYNDISDLKSDENVYNKFNKGNNPNVQNALRRLNLNSFVRNEISYIKTKFNLRNKLNINFNNTIVKTSNVNDLYDLINTLIA